jgi:hypothetical protein
MLSDEMITVGAELVRRIDETDLDLRAALWWYSTERDAWELLFAFARVKQLGARKFYRQIDSVLRRLAGSEVITLADTHVIDASDPIVGAVRSVRRVKGERRSRIKGEILKGVLIDDALIYHAA